MCFYKLDSCSLNQFLRLDPAATARGTDTHYSSLITHHSLLITHYSLLITNY
jgi:hypothetical protein